jgi:flagellar protein FliL
MADENIEEQAAEDAAPKKSKKLLFIILIAVGLMAGGAGGFFYWRHRVAKQREAAAANAEKKEKHEGGEEDVAEVIELLPFIVNLADREEPKYLRMTVSLGISEASEKPDPLFTTKIRNAILAVVTTKTAEEILTVEGKKELRKAMLEAAQSAAHKPEVKAIYITDFIVQM